MSKKKIVSIVVALSMIGNVSLATSAVANTQNKVERKGLETSGACGDGVTYTFTADGRLTISGSGDMYNYSSSSCTYDSSSTNCVSTAPWGSYSTSIASLSIADGITSIGDYAFLNCRFTSIQIPSSVKTICSGAFKFCYSLKEQLIIPSSVTSIGSSAFFTCPGLTSVVYYGFTNPSTSTFNNMFSNCNKLSTVNVPNCYQGDTFCGKSVSKTLYCPTPMPSPTLQPTPFPSPSATPVPVKITKAFNPYLSKFRKAIFLKI